LRSSQQIRGAEEPLELAARPCLFLTSKRSLFLTLYNIYQTSHVLEGFSVSFHHGPSHPLPRHPMRGVVRLFQSKGSISGDRVQRKLLPESTRFMLKIWHYPLDQRSRCTCKPSSGVTVNSIEDVWLYCNVSGETPRRRLTGSCHCRQT
jgi:hypothetical protein